MKYPPPIFRTGAETYHIDTQAPQREAMDSGRAEIHCLSHGNYIGTRIPDDALPGLSSLGWMNMVGAQNWGIEPHRNEGIEIAFVEAGTTPFVVDGVAHALRAGDLTITRPWQLHQLGNPHLGPVRMHWVIIDLAVRRPNQRWRWPSWVLLTPQDRAELTLKLSQNEQPIHRHSPGVQRAFEQIADVLARPEPLPWLSHLTIHLNVLLLELLESLRRHGGVPDPHLVSHERTIDLFLHDLVENPLNLARPWTLQSMAEECGVGATAFHKYCRQKTNASPMDYLRRCRLGLAAGLLVTQPTRAITDIALACGFSTSQYFSYQFRRAYHVSPKTYRQRRNAAG